LFLLVFAVALITPHAIQGHVLIPKEYAQSAVLAIDVVLAYIFYILYRRDVERVEKENKRIGEDLLGAYKYFGEVNRKNEILGRFLIFLNQYDDYPSDQDIFEHLMKSIFVSVLQSDKGLLRFVDSGSSRTVKEYQFHKEKDKFAIRISNKVLLSGKHNNSDSVFVIESGISKNGIKCFLCYEKKDDVERDDKFIQSLVNQVYLLFLASNKTRLQNQAS
jgi:hypothetical protein